MSRRWRIVVIVAATSCSTGRAAHELDEYCSREAGPALRLFGVDVAGHVAADRAAADGNHLLHALRERDYSELNVDSPRMRSYILRTLASSIGIWALGILALVGVPCLLCRTSYRQLPSSRVAQYEGRPRQMLGYVILGGVVLASAVTGIAATTSFSAAASHMACEALDLLLDVRAFFNNLEQPVAELAHAAHQVYDGADALVSDAAAALDDAAHVKYLVRDVIVRAFSPPAPEEPPSSART